MVVVLGHYFLQVLGIHQVRSCGGKNARFGVILRNQREIKSKYLYNWNTVSRGK